LKLPAGRIAIRSPRGKEKKKLQNNPVGKLRVQASDDKIDPPIIIYAAINQTTFTKACRF